MRVEKISTNQPNFEGKNYKSIFNRFTNTFSKTSDAQVEKIKQTFVALAGASSAIALTAIAINKKQEEEKAEPQIKEEIKQPEKTLDEIFPDLPEVSEPKLQALERKIRYDERSRYIINEKVIGNRSLLGKREVQLVNKLLDDDKLINNPKLRRNMAALILSRRGRDMSTKQAKVIDYIMSNPRLYNNENLVKNATEALPYVDESNINSVLRVLSDERFDKTYFYAYA